MLREGGVIAQGFEAELDELRAIQTNCGEFLLAFEAQEKERTGIAGLKVEYNSVHGFYIELSRAQAENAPPEYRRRQTLKNAERYITPELKTFEDKVLQSAVAMVLGAVGLYEPRVLGVGYEHVDAILSGTVLGWSLLALDRQALPAINLGVFNSCQPNPRGECCTSDLRPPRHFPAPLLLEVPQLANSSAPIKNYGVF